MKTILLSTILGLLLVRCNNPINPTTSTDKESRIILSINDSIFQAASEIEITAHIYNKGDKDITINQIYILENPILSLTVFDDKANIIPPIPPPVPQLKNDSSLTKILKPKESYRIKYDLNIFSTPLPKGRYEVAMTGELSNKVRFRIE